MAPHGQETEAEERARVTEYFRGGPNASFCRTDILPAELSEKAVRAHRLFMTYATHLAEIYLEDRAELAALQVTLPTAENTKAYRVAERYAAQAQEDVAASQTGAQ